MVFGARISRSLGILVYVSLVPNVADQKMRSCHRCRAHMVMLFDADHRISAAMGFSKALWF